LGDWADVLEALGFEVVPPLLDPDLYIVERAGDQGVAGVDGAGQKVGCVQAARCCFAGEADRRKEFLVPCPGEVCVEQVVAERGRLEGMELDREGRSQAFAVIGDAAITRNARSAPLFMHPGSANGEHPIGHDEIQYVIAGQGEVVSDGEERLLIAGMAGYL